MSRVPTSRTPQRPPAPAQANRPRRILKAKEPEKAIKIKAGNSGGAEEGDGAMESQRPEAPGEAREKGEGWIAHGLAHEEHADEAVDEAHEELRKEQEKEAERSQPKTIGKLIGKPQQGNKPQQQPQQAKKDGFERQQGLQNQASGVFQKLSSADLQKAQQAHAAQKAAEVQKATALSQSQLKPVSNRPPDAFTLLNQAKEPGVLFKEDYDREGHSEDQDDPELAAAVEEAIRLLFGVRGILRVGPGRNEANEPVIIVVAAQGFGEVSLKAVPPKVGKFETLLAVPFDLLPLKKDRF